MCLHSLSPIHDQLQQIAIRIEEIQAIVITPVNRSLVPNPSLGKGGAGALEISVTHPKSVMPLPERLLYPVQIRRGEIPPLEEGEGRTGKIEDDLIAKAAGHPEAQYAGVKRLRRGEVAHLNPKVV